MSPIRVLLVDDEQLVLSCLRRLLQREHFTARTAASGAEALELLEREPVDLVVADYQMPGMTGIELLRDVAQRWPAIWRCMLTAQADKELLDASLENGLLHRAFTKPWDNRFLVAELLSVAGAGGAGGTAG